jgi:hypothetical protein
MRRELLPLLAFVVALTLVGPALVQLGESPSAVERVPPVVEKGAVQPARAQGAARACFALVRRCERIRERRGGIETRLGAVKDPRR